MRLPKGTIHLRRQHFLGGRGQKIGQNCQRIVVKNCRPSGMQQRIRIHGDHDASIFQNYRMWRDKFTTWSKIFWDHPFKTLVNFFDFWALPFSVGSSLLLFLGNFGQILTPSPPKKCWHLTWMVPFRSRIFVFVQLRFHC